MVFQQNRNWSRWKKNINLSTNQCQTTRLNSFQKKLNQWRCFMKKISEDFVKKNGMISQKTGVFTDCLGYNAKQRQWFIGK